MSPTIGELLSVTVDPENAQKILCIGSCEQSSSPTIVTYCMRTMLNDFKFAYHDQIVAIDQPKFAIFKLFWN